MTETNLARSIEAASDASRYDTNVKLLLADKQILTRILKYAVKEFQNMGIQDIMESIGNDIEIGTKPVDAGLSNLGRVKEGENLKDSHNTLISMLEEVLSRMEAEGKKSVLRLLKI